MKRIVTVEQMKKLDGDTVHNNKIPSMVLMERAALAACDVLFENQFPLDRILVISGYGNNGGDGLAIARLLYLKGYSVEVCMIGDPHRASRENMLQETILHSYQVPVTTDPDYSSYSTIIDAVFGIGLSRNISQEMQELFSRVNTSGAKVLAIDIPSGVAGNTGKLMGAAICADHTVTFAYGKPGLYLYPGAEYAGTVSVCDIGIYDRDQKLAEPLIQYVEDRDISLIPKRKKDGNKGSFGKVLLIAGSRDMPGAAWMAARACMRAGAGMVKVYTSVENKRILLEKLPEAMVVGYDTVFDETVLEGAMRWADIIGIGPGLGTSSVAKQILAYVLKHSEKPLVIDADGLNIISENPVLLKEHKGETIITPHPGEISRLLNCSVLQVTDDLPGRAAQAAGDFSTICILKSAVTVTALGNNRFFFNLSGNSGMGTAGSGDVLTGLLLGLLAQGMEIQLAAPLGVWIHGKIGDELVKTSGEYSLIAGDLIEGISRIIR